MELLFSEKDLRYEVIDLDRKEKLPIDFDALIVLGGPDSANDKTEKIKRKLNFIKNVLDKKYHISEYVWYATSCKGNW